MNGKTRINILILLAIIIALADAYWIYLDYSYSILIGVILGIIIFIANAAWIYVEM